ncbi:hypothetical protein FQN50_001911 [Emmonsiellopsis sp. PD_5]|nr:hypothetical protein FQN50_001911 [Emmonsiellopsis sp. PD_5]
MDSNEPFPPSTTLKAIHTSLHLLYHRNKNQHRNTKWFKWLSMLRRATADLTRDVERFEKNDDDDDVKEMILRRMGAFSTVIADTQFSALGVVLLATLAQASQAVRAGEAYYSSPATATADDGVAAAAALNSRHVDVGEVVMRSAYTSVSVGGTLAKAGVGGAGSPVPGVGGEGGMGRRRREEGSGVEWKRGEEREREREREKGKEKEKEKKRKKRKKGNAIDDIFGGL